MVESRRLTHARVCERGSYFVCLHPGPCTFEPGDTSGNGGTETEAGTAQSKEECEALVVANHPDAKAATWGSNNKKCYAEFYTNGRTIGSQESEYMTCELRGCGSAASKVMTEGAV